MNKKLFAILVVALCTLGLTGSALAQLLNGGFENWTINGAGGPPDYWLSSSGSLTGSQEAVTVHGGTYSVNLTWTTTSTVQLFQLVPVTTGQAYDFSFWTYDMDTGGRTRVALRWMNPVDTSFVAGFYGVYSTDVGWQQLSTGSQTAQTDLASCEIRVYDISGWPGTATCYADDATFEDVTPPPPPDTVTIYEMQYQTTATGTCFDSPLIDSTVVTKGIVTAVQYNGFYIQEAEAEWSGVFCFYYSPPVARGDEVVVTGDVVEYYGMTEMNNITDIVTLSSGNTVSPIVIETGDLAGGCNVGSEAFEGVLVKVIWVTCTQDINDYGEWYVDDGSGACQVDDPMLSYDPTVGQDFHYILGPVDFSFDEYAILPRDPGGISPTAVELASFEATAGDGQVTLIWRTASEIDNHSFNIYRDEVKIASVPAFGDAHDYIYVDRKVVNGQTYSYQLSDVALDGSETIHPVVCSVTPTAVPTAYALHQNYPNPFNPSTDISYAIPAETHVTLKVYNLLGQEMATLVDDTKSAGKHTVSWNASENASGVYFYRLETNDFSATKKMVYMK
jgi:hypothetical protein